MKIKIGELYNFAKEFYGDNIPKNSLKFQNEKLLEMHLKKDDVFEIKLDNNEIILPAANHVLYTLENKEIFVKDIKEGDVLFNNIKVKEIKKIKENVNVYDVSVDNNSSTYILADTKHHNTGSVRIQNLFRTILNGNIGSTKIPPNVYIIYASNTDNTDGSLDDIPTNHQFEKVKFDKPDKDEFLRYIADKFADDSEDSDKTEPIVKTDVYNAFAEVLTDDDLGGKDENDNRISPRRWEEIMKLVSASLPVNDVQEARALLTVFKENFSNYEDETIQQTYFKYEKVLKKLIGDTSGISNDLVPFTKKDWKHSLDSELNIKLKLGSARKYSPVISGTPGIGKTTIIRDIAEKRKLKLIEIDASTLNTDDTMGLTTPTEKNGVLTTTFTKPPLLKRILEGYDPELKKDSDQKYTHLLFLDELSRTKPQVFNVLRALLLENKVGTYSIPDDIMIISAMNPHDKGTNLLTDHMKDVVDVIQSEADYFGVMDYLKDSDIVKNVNKTFKSDISTPLFGVMDRLVDILGSDTDTDDNEISDLNTRKFYWTDGMNVIYVSAREMDDMLLGSLTDLYNSYTILGEEFDFSSDEKLMEFTNNYYDIVFEKISNFISFIVEEKFKLENSTTTILVKALDNQLIQFKKDVFDILSKIESELKINLTDVFEKAGSTRIMLSDPGINDIMQRVSDNSVDDIIYSFKEIVNTLMSKHDVVKNKDGKITENLVKELIDLYDIGLKLKDSEVNNEILQGISDAIIESGIKVVVSSIVNIPENDFEITLLDDDYISKIKIISEKYSENKNIM